MKMCGPCDESPSRQLKFIFTPDQPKTASLKLKMFSFRLLGIPYLFDLAPWALIKFLDLESGRLFEAGRLLNFRDFQQKVSLFM